MYMLVLPSKQIDINQKNYLISRKIWKNYSLSLDYQTIKMQNFEKKEVFF